MGNAADLRKMADDLDTVRESMLAVYLKRSALDRDGMIALLDEDRWMAVAEAQEKGFVDVTDDTRVAASLRGPGAWEVNGHAMEFRGAQPLPLLYAPPPPPDPQASDPPPDAQPEPEDTSTASANAGAVPVVPEEPGLSADLAGEPAGGPALGLNRERILTLMRLKGAHHE
jgi:ATP-dependent Clp protease protease subunit